MNELANIQKNTMSSILGAGEKVCKSAVLDGIPERFAEFHRQGYIHIHDLEFYDKTYNCIGVSVSDLVKDTDIQVSTVLRRLYRGIVSLTNNQSGGIGFLDFDGDMAAYRMDESDEILTEAFRNFFEDLNIYSRKGCEKPYTTLNIGCRTSTKARRIAKAVLSAALEGNSEGKPFIFPNIVFKYSRAINGTESSPNYDIFQMALKGTASRMIPTYFNCDAPFNRNANPNKIGIMGCRTRVVADIHGNTTGLNRGNIACVTTNLVRLAIDSNHDFQVFLKKIGTLFEECKELLLHRFATLCKGTSPIFAIEKGLYLDSEKGREVALMHGTLSIGFIGLWDALSELLDTDFSDVDNLRMHHGKALAVLQVMRQKVDSFIEQSHMNFSLLASAAEATTGIFADRDFKEYGIQCKSAAKGFYTNSFHIPVDTSIRLFEKIQLEAPFHKLCNGGCISYVELDEQPCYNVGAIQKVVEFAMKNNCNYFGINFPLDQCNACGHFGRIGDTCSSCGSSDILRLRRVSGYLSEKRAFTKGKKRELNLRKASF
ncbi:anaerobic ribonucleoside-triphosphate reductase [Fibrobacter succinogenes subsp. succinogenes S85]|uniref:Anaerobic ribonucleoside-triphosphate reductase n=1 Tax=Fibrobacter succinogenes (strain ATCC 19169 / S85) TaxID=59374 RepID=C9RJ61_FIBSS|nr:anaerobic ribonucleoside-triphosphate reductase [Fibrobacter succinogenes]ACX73705.1 anaerobic ribonucleoside-triphosphate reductase [Fibrobacter succinogenes subsp. succinogenes S85]ADL25951.1 anaerobic ribonucleoside-triphosphate reductase [Fibrobacter succinogenes subsp. succinogenes S85]